MPWLFQQSLQQQSRQISATRAAVTVPSPWQAHYSPIIVIPSNLCIYVGTLYQIVIACNLTLFIYKQTSKKLNDILFCLFRCFFILVRRYQQRSDSKFPMKFFFLIMILLINLFKLIIVNFFIYFICCEIFLLYY
jgi:hypothetical protein